MPKARSRFSSRHLLAVCTFVVPLGLLAWFGGTALQRQVEQAQTEREGQALFFLRSVVRTIEERFGDILPPASAKAAELLAEASTVTVTRRLREQEQVPALLDILLLDDEGQLVYPLPPPVDMGLPFGAPPPFGPSSRGDPAISDALQAADLYARLGELQAAAELCQQILDDLQQPSQGRRGRTDEFELRAIFLLATVQKKLGLPDASRSYQRVREIIADRSRATGWAMDAEKQAVDLLAQLEMRTLAKDREGCLGLMRSIADGDHDLIADGMLAAVQQRLLQMFPAETAEHAVAVDSWRDDQARQHARLFAADYEDFLKQQISRRLVASDGAPFHQVFTLGSAGSLLWIRPATEPERRRQRNCAYLCLRFDLSLLLDFTDRFQRENGSPFVLAMFDPDGVPLGSPPLEAPPNWEAPTLPCYGMQLRAVPSDLGSYLAQAQSSARTRTLLVTGLFLVAIAGAIWLWRSVSREAELAAMKVDLVSRVSHELKTPLALIRMYGETLGLGRAKDAEQATRFGAIIAREADRLTSMIQRLLDFARQQAGTLTYAQKPTDLGELLRRLEEAYRPHITARGASLLCQFEQGIRANVDAQALESAVVNLLENAAKYATEENPDRSIELRLAAVGDTATIDVLDRGRGVPPAELDHVFDSFRRGSNAGEVRGAGLGLSLVRHFALAHGGNVVAMPRQGGGSIFRLTLPIQSQPS